MIHTELGRESTAGMRKYVWIRYLKNGIGVRLSDRRLSLAPLWRGREKKR